MFWDCVESAFTDKAMEHHLVQQQGPPQGWWYVRPVPHGLHQDLGRRCIRRFLAVERSAAQLRGAEVHEEVQRLLQLSSGSLQLRGREVRLVAGDCARHWQSHALAAGATPVLPDEADLVELLINGFRSRGLVLEEAQFLEAREAFLAQCEQPTGSPPPHGRRATTVAGWMARRQQQRSLSASTRSACQRELQRLLQFSAVSLPQAISEGAAWRWRNHVLSSVSLPTARRRLSLIEAVYRDACSSGLLQHNPFSGLPPLQLSPLPPKPLDQERLEELDRSRSADPIYWLVRLLGLRPVEAAALRPIDFARVEEHRVLWIRSWHLREVTHHCPASSVRCLPLPNALLDLWESCSGNSLEPLWSTAELVPTRLARRWGDQLRRRSGISATALRAERRRIWREAGADQVVLKHLLGGSFDQPDPVGARALELMAWMNTPPLALAPRMLHCPTEPTNLAVCAR